MSRPRDRYGYEMSTHSDAAARHYMAAMDAELAATPGFEASLRAALDADPGFALPRIALARELQFGGKGAEARGERDIAVADAGGTTRREQQHVAVLSRAIDGDGPGALALLREHLAEFPRDAFAASQAAGPFSLIAFGGGPDWRIEHHEFLAPLAPAYGVDWWFDSTMAFALNELYRFAEARKLAERSIQARPDSGAGAHTMAHVQFETGELEEGCGYMRGWLGSASRDGRMFGHNTWHLALFEVLAGRPEVVTQLWQETLGPEAYPGRPVIAVSDSASLLWRCGLYGLGAPDGAEGATAAYARSAFPRPGVTFADTHCALAYAAAGDFEALEGLRAGMRARLEAGKMPPGPVAVAIVDAVLAFAREDHAGAVEALLPWRQEVVRIGGSNAQRQVFEDTLIEAALRAGRVDVAGAILAERLQRRPSAHDRALAARCGRPANPASRAN